MPLTLTIQSTSSPAGLSMLLRLLGTTDFDQGYDIALDSSGNFFVSGESEAGFSSAIDLFVAKYNPSGVVQWYNMYTNVSGSNRFGRGVATDSSGNAYVAGYSTIGGISGNDILLLKFASSTGALQWERTLGGGNTEQCHGITIDSSDNIYIVGRTDSFGPANQNILIAKYNTSGVIQWQRVLGGTSYEYGYAVTTDSSGNVYIVGLTASEGPGGESILIAKYNASGTIQWQRVLGGASNDQGYGITADSSGNIYITGLTASQGAGSTDIIIAKYNSSGTIQWQRTLGDTGIDEGRDVVTDSSGNVYLVGRAGTTSANILIAKYDASGAIQWQRTLGGSSSELSGGIGVDSSNNIYIAGQTDNSAAVANTDILIARVKNDGSGTGTFGTFTYQVTAQTDQASTLTDQASTLTDQASTLTEQAAPAGNFETLGTLAVTPTIIL